MKLFLTYDKSLCLVNTYQALKVLNVDKETSQDEIKSAYRKLALEQHPDKNKNKKETMGDVQEILKSKCKIFQINPYISGLVHLQWLNV